MCVYVSLGLYLCLQLHIPQLDRFRHVFCVIFEGLWLDICSPRVSSMDRCWRQQCPDSFRQLLSPLSALLSSLPPSPLTDVATPPPPPLSFLWAQPVLTLNICPGGACSVLVSLYVCVCVCWGWWWCRFCNLKHTQTFSLCMNMYTYEHTHTPVRAEVEGWFVLFSSRQSD